MSWPLVRLEDVTKLITCGVAKRPDYVDEGIPFLSAKNVKGGEIIFEGFNCITPEAHAALTKHNKPLRGDILYTRVGSVGEAAIVNIDEEFSVFVSLTLIKVDDKKLFNGYLKHLLNSEKFKKIASDNLTGIGVGNLNVSVVREYLIPLPPLGEQKRIAAILDKADAIRRKRQQSIKLADDFLRSVFLEMFGDPVTNPKGWEVRKLGEVSDSQLGKMLSSKAKVGEYPKRYLRNANVRWREFDLENMLEMDFDEREMKKFNLVEGDLLVCEGGEIGRCAIWHGELSECYFQKALHRLRVNTDVLTPEYVQEYFYWMSVNGGLIKSASEVTFSHLTAEKLKTLNIPVPPFALQMKFSSFYKKYECLKKKSKNLSAVDSNIFASLSQKEFSGK